MDDSEIVDDACDHCQGEAILFYNECKSISIAQTPGCPTDGVANEVLQKEYLQRLAALCHQGSPGWQECTHCAANWFRKEPLFSVPLHNYREDHSPAPHCQPDNEPDESSRGYRAESHLPWHITE